MSEKFNRRTRRHIIKLYEDGKSTREIAAAVGGSVSGVRRVRQHHRERGTIEPLSHAGGHAGRTPALEAALRELHEQQPDAYLHELRDRLEENTGVSKGLSTVGRWLLQMGITRKKRPPTPPNSSVKTSPRPEPTGSTC